MPCYVISLSRNTFLMSACQKLLLQRDVNGVAINYKALNVNFLRENKCTPALS